MLKLKRDDLGGPRRAAHRLQELLYDYIDFCAYVGDGEEDEAAETADHFLYLAGWDNAEVNTEKSGWDARMLHAMGGEIVEAACRLDAKSDFVEQEENAGDATL